MKPVSGASFAFLVLMVVAEIPASAQIGYPGGYPPGGYPPGGYPGGYPPGGYPGGYPGGVGLPIPHRKKKQQSKEPKEQEAALQSYTGVLRRIEDKSIVLEAQDTRILNFKRTDKTKFLKNSEESKPSKFKPGDHLLVEASQDDQGFLYAVNVNLEKEGTAQERAEASAPADVSTQSSQDDDERPRLRRSDAPAKAPSPSQAPATVQDKAPPPSQAPATAHDTKPPQDTPAAQPQISDHARVAEDGDPDRPILRRGKPAPRRREPDREIASAAPPERPAAVSGPPAAAPADIEPAPEAPAPPSASTAQDATLTKARTAVSTFMQGLPNYVCTEMITRYVNTTHVVDWRPLDTVSTEVVYENGHERYTSIKINGKESGKQRMEDLSGAWSTGEFGSVLADLFSRATAADFRFRKPSTIVGRSARIYDFTVEHENSHWHVQVPSQSVMPGYRGSVWIDQQNGRILRIEMQASNLPEAFPLDRVESATDYDYVRFGEKEFLLPVHAEVLSCERDRNDCSRNTIDFRNYHKYEGESTIIFDKDK